MEEIKEEKKPLNKNLIIGIVIVILLLGGVTTLWLIERQKKNELEHEFQLEKEDVENEYANFVSKFDELKEKVSNDSLSTLLEREQIKTQQLLDELRSVKSSNAREIRRLKSELGRLRKIMVGYINQIDSLNRLTHSQKQIIRDVTRKYNEASKRVNTLDKERKTLTEKVALAAQLDASDIRVYTQKKSGRSTAKAKKVRKIKIEFNINKNITAKTGKQMVYIRIVAPDNTLLSRSDETFKYENRLLKYSIDKMVEYRGEELKIFAYWMVDEYLFKGDYRVEIFAGGKLIGKSVFKLK